MAEDHLHGVDGDGPTALPPTIEGLRQAIAGAHEALNHIDDHLANASTSDKALECCQANVHDLMVSLPTWQAVLTRTRHLNSRRN